MQPCTRYRVEHLWRAINIHAKTIRLVFDVQDAAIDPTFDQCGGVLAESPVSTEIRAVPTLAGLERLNRIFPTEYLRIAVRNKATKPNMIESVSVRSPICSISSDSGGPNHGLSRYDDLIIIELGGGLTTNLMWVGSVAKSLFHPSQISEPTALMVGISTCQLLSETLTASSTKTIWQPSKDLIFDTLVRNPANRNSDPLRLVMLAFCTSK